MSSNRLLQEPLTADVSRDGRLIRADDALARLHILAGGVTGGFLAVPALAALAALTFRIKMRLARAVQVAENDDDIELWVESGLRDDVVRLTVLGWRRIGQNIGVSPLVSSTAPTFGHTGTMLELHFDPDVRLISATGAGVESLSASHFGRDIEETINLSSGDAIELRTAITAQRSLQIAQVTLNGNEQTYAMSLAPRLREGDSLAGFTCALVPVERVIDQSVPLEQPGSLFGRQLAPALRQPLGRIIANAETIGSKLQGPIRESYATYAKDIADAARHLVALVDDLGDLEAVERPDFATAKDLIELGDVARRVAGLLALKAADHRITLQTPDDALTVKATAEFRRALQIVLNLVMNAIRYSPDGTTVQIDIETGADFSVLSVSDQGCGIPENDREKIFEKFERLGRSGDGGSGLGLYISRRLARAMGGELSVSQSRSGGAKFTLRLPN